MVPVQISRLLGSRVEGGHAHLYTVNLSHRSLAPSQLGRSSPSPTLSSCPSLLPLIVSQLVPRKGWISPSRDLSASSRLRTRLFAFGISPGNRASFPCHQSRHGLVVPIEHKRHSALLAPAANMSCSNEQTKAWAVVSMRRQCTGSAFVPSNFRSAPKGRMRTPRASASTGQSPTNLETTNWNLS